MFYREEIKDLFLVSEDYYLAHCISADFALGKGIAVEFNKKFDMKNKLQTQYPNFVAQYNNGHCILIDKIFNLITKEKYFYKPTYASLFNALSSMKKQCLRLNIKKVAMPIIGCGLDRLQWNQVSNIIQSIFSDMDIEILVCKK